MAPDEAPRFRPTGSRARNGPGVGHYAATTDEHRLERRADLAARQSSGRDLQGGNGGGRTWRKCNRCTRMLHLQDIGPEDEYYPS